MKKKIGIFDSGVGGLTVYKAIRAAFPGEDLVYFGDTARVPYGPKSPHTVIDYSVQNARFLLQQGLKILVVACNTSSAVALEAIRQLTKIPIIGVIEPGSQAAVHATQSGRIGVIGTEGTVRSQAYSHAITALKPDAEVFTAACPLFVPLVEEGWQDSQIAFEVADKYLEPFRKLDIDTLVLGCTHYPLLSSVISRVMGEKVRLVDSAQAISLYLKQIVGESDAPEKGKDSFFVSDSEEKFAILAEQILQEAPAELQRVRLFESWFLD